MYIRDYPASQYSYSQEIGDFTLELEKPPRYVPWCSVNPYPSAETKDEEMAKFPLYFRGPKPFECTVNPGEILYFRLFSCSLQLTQLRHVSILVGGKGGIKGRGEKISRRMFKTHGCLIGGIRIGNGLVEGFKILRTSPLLILLKLEGLEEGIHSKHDKGKVVPPPYVFSSPRPGMWFHHVRQSPDDRGRTIAFDIKYAYFNFLQSIHHPAIQNGKLPKTECNDPDSDVENSFEG
ncbi:hypothetical protein TIFTF001_014161 [Ficus carica]|uniref:Uncharacterized protein n=1 Tax=Ficus carica TaxID=3494 RepID=A0AA88D6R5_FICCA|nr:hypothetical protein TIFTF001_014161 [Ficus carica]